MKEKLQAALLAHHPTLKPLMAARYVDKYVAVVLNEIARQYARLRSEDISEGEMDFPIDLVTKACGAARAVAPNATVFGVLQEHPNTSLVLRTYNGNSISHRVSCVTLNPNYKKEIMTALKSLYVELEPKHLAELSAKANKIIRINAESLASYIEQTRNDLNTQHSEAYEAKLIRNLQVATQLLQMAKEDDEGAYLEEYWEQIDSGRVHGHGLSLQRIPKEVRHAALGHCFRYDFKAASYALMTWYALCINPTLKTAAIAEYVRDRTAIRKRIARDVGVSEKSIKTVMTAIGFGAQLKDNPYSAICQELGREKYHRLLANTEFVFIKKQLDAIRDTISAALGTGDFEVDGMFCTDHDPKSGTKRTKNQKLAWLYQRLETFAMEQFIKRVPADCKPLLVVHDCLYLGKQIPTEQLVDIKLELRNMFPMLDMESEWVVPIHAPGYMTQGERAAREEVAAHRARIAAEEQRARFYESPSCHNFSPSSPSSPTRLTPHARHF